MCACMRACMCGADQEFVATDGTAAVAFTNLAPLDAKFETIVGGCGGSALKVR